MNPNIRLTEGVINRILNNEIIDRPLVQVLASKVITDGRIRCCLFDGVQQFNHCVVINNNNEFSNQLLDKFSVIRLDKYKVSVHEKNNVSVILVYDLTLVSKASQKFDSNNQISGGFVEPRNTGPVFGNNSLNLSCVETNDCIKSGMSLIDKSKLCPITAITPFFHSFVIRARVTTKSPVRTYNKNREGKLFSFDVTDDSSEIRVVAFNSECDKYYDIIEKDMVYYISKGNVKSADKKFNNLKCEYEITLTSDSVIEVCNESIPLPRLMFRFIQLKELVNTNPGSSVDVIGIVRSVNDLETIVSKKNSKEYKKRDVLLLDKSCCEVRLTLWGKEAEELVLEIGSVLAVKNSLVGEFRGKTLGCVQNTTIEINPDLSDAHILKGWYDREGKHVKEIISLSKTIDQSIANVDKYLCQIRIESIPENTVFYFNTKASILSLNNPQKHMYKSCVNNNCNKKVIEENGIYRCDKCNTSCHGFEWRLMISVLVCDCTGQLWVTAFQETAEKIIGISFSELCQIFSSDPDRYRSIVSNLDFKVFDLRIGSKIDTYNDEKRVKSTCFSATPINTISRAKKLIQNIKLWSQK